MNFYHGRSRLRLQNVNTTKMAEIMPTDAHLAKFRLASLGVVIDDLRQLEQRSFEFIAT